MCGARTRRASKSQSAMFPTPVEMLGRANDNGIHVATTSASMCVCCGGGISIHDYVVDLVVDVVLLLDMSLLPVLSRSDENGHS